MSPPVHAQFSTLERRTVFGNWEVGIVNIGTTEYFPSDVAH